MSGQAWIVGEDDVLELPGLDPALAVPPPIQTTPMPIVTNGQAALPVPIYPDQQRPTLQSFNGGIPGMVSASEQVVTGDLSKPPLGAPMSQINQGMDWAKNQFSNWFTNQGNIQKALDQIYSGYRDRLQGYDAPTMQAMRKQAGDVINGQAQTGMRLAGSRNSSAGIRGAAANAANLQIADKASQARAAAENELIVKNDAVRRQALKDFDSMVTSERAGVLSSIMGGADMYNKVLAHDDMMKLLQGYQSDAAKKAAEAQAAADGEFSGWKNQINKLLPTYFGGDRAVLPALDPLTAAHFQQWGWIDPQGEAFPGTQNIGGNYNILSGLGI